MNIYDPADYVSYVRMDRSLAPPVGSRRPTAAIRLPSDYANESPRTSLRKRAPRRPSDIQAASWAAPAARCS